MKIAETAEIHPSAIIEEGARIGSECKIGPFSFVGSKVTLGNKVELRPNSVVKGRTTLGDESLVFSFATVGEIPQDLKYAGEDTELIIGKRARIREGATLNIGTKGGGGITRVGDDCLVMTGAHVAHDAHIGDRVILVNNVAVAGHAIIEDDVVIGGLSGIHQFARVGRGAMIGGICRVPRDVLPYGLVQSSEAHLDGLNLVGLKRRGASREDIRILRDAYDKLASDEGSFAERAEWLKQNEPNKYVQEVVSFILDVKSDRGFITPA